MDDLIVKFCEDRRSWLFVTAVTLGLCLVFVLPCVDEYVAVCSEKTEVADQLALAKESAELLPGLEKRRAEQIATVNMQLGKTLCEENEAEYRNSVVKMVRETGCQLRRLNIGSPTSRDWGLGDDPLEKITNKKLQPSGFQLERRQVSLSLVGPSAGVRRLIERLEEQDKQVYVQAIELKPGTGDGRRVELTMELWYFTLKSSSV